MMASENLLQQSKSETSKLTFSDKLDSSDNSEFKVDQRDAYTRQAECDMILFLLDKLIAELSKDTFGENLYEKASSSEAEMLLSEMGVCVRKPSV